MCILVSHIVIKANNNKSKQAYSQALGATLNVCHKKPVPMPLIPTTSTARQ